MHDLTCAEVGDASAEYALDILESGRRAEVAAHILRCRTCREEVNGMRAAADQLLELVPGTEPPLGFDRRVLERFGHPITPNRRRLRVVLTAAAAVLIAVAATVGAVTSGGSHSTAPKVTYEAALEQGSRTVGEVYVYGGRAPWIDMMVKGLPGKGPVSCELVESSGGLEKLGSFDLIDGSGSWGAPDHWPDGAVTGVQLRNSSDQVVATAEFTS